MKSVLFNNVKPSERGKRTVSQNGYAELKSLDDLKKHGVEVFADAEFPDQVYVTVPYKSTHRTFPIGSKRLAEYLRCACHMVAFETVTPAAVKAWLDIQATEVYFGDQTKVLATRTARDNDAMYIDLANEDGTCIKITGGDWSVVDTTPMVFFCPEGMRALPTPERGGDIQKLWSFMNVKSQHDQLLLLVWMLAAMLPTGPYPVLFVTGEHGTAKSTLVRYLRRLIDPSAAPLRSFPRAERDLFAAARYGRLLAYDNLSGLTRQMSDSLCRVSTGAGFSMASSYSSSEETLCNAQRPIVFNGIEEIAFEPDLLDRAVSLTLPVVSDEDRRTEAELNKEFEDEAPKIFGALLTLLAQSLEALPNINLTKLPRMADFATLGASVAQQLEYEPEVFLKVFESNRAQGDAVAIDSSPVGAAVRAWAFAVEKGRVLEGTPTKVSGVLRKFLPDTEGHMDGPINVARFSNRLRVIAPNLRRYGIAVEFTRTAPSRWIKLEMTRDLTREERSEAQPGLGVVVHKPETEDDLKGLVDVDDSNDNNDGIAALN